MKLVDINLLLYAINQRSRDHARAKAWLESALSGEEGVALPWSVVIGFLRLTTSRGPLQTPLTTAAAMGIVDGWLARDMVSIIGPGPEHGLILRSLLESGAITGNLVNDAHLAALAIEHGAELCSADGDFSRFKDLRWTNPLAA